MRKFMMMVGVVLLAGCSARGEDDGDTVGDRVGDWSTTLGAVNNSSVRGSAGAQSVGVGTGATITINNAQAGAHHPWHIHAGTCGSGGAIMGDASAYPVLHVAADGRASANATINVPLNEQSSYHVNVHRSPTDLPTIIACGNLDND